MASTNIPHRAMADTLSQAIIDADDARRGYTDPGGEQTVGFGVVSGAPPSFWGNIEGHSVIQDWVTKLCTLRQQGVLLIGLRGPDGCTKEDACKPLIRTIRGCVLNTGRTGKPLEWGDAMEGDSFMTMALIARPALWYLACKEFFSSVDQYNEHFLGHLYHAAEVLGYKHWDERVRSRWQDFYERAAEKRHMNPETLEQMDIRLRNGIRPEHDE